ncbi:hypothetical protein ACH5RR_023250 [Cinchona calisaya]|uniref:Uncharacterized protein n=1 Tax=Cinchona calisaya TaxID=153742 RepID=A0ABD2ZF43_9GENT
MLLVIELSCFIVCLMYLLLMIGRVIHEQIFHVAGIKSKGLWFPCLITQLCVNAGVQWDKMRDKQIAMKKPIDVRAVIQMNKKSEQKRKKKASNSRSFST